VTDATNDGWAIALRRAFLSEFSAGPEPAPAAKAKSVIWTFFSGGHSHLETFDPKPALNPYAGKTFAQTPLANPVESPLHKKRFRSVAAHEVNVRDVYPTMYPMQVG